ncbi:nickel pincer cofactor biosynthesis protein LarB [Acuticoccus kandeliae]|uniref:nickel pincer cofactor biosynthesis protein LarB n=1 Tax=Acuticoccus kandeliae TaxID=2073160 RepID=UPI000D3EB3A4|nr:nickel pincer cofactor biosynthesis protein LarB [Acuticoccus kandeliae]
MSDFTIDWDREARTGVAEAVLCDGKTPAQIAAILASAGPRRLFLTRLSEDAHGRLPETARARLDYDPLSRTAVHGEPVAPTMPGVGVVCAGTSDLPVAREAARALAFAGFDAPVIADVGVAGLWRLMNRLPEIREQRVVIAVAGMEGALFSVLAGLVAAPVVAVPTSVGYGVAEGGKAALSSALASCAAGLVTVNIDNGFGAASAAIRIFRAMSRDMSEKQNSA